MKSDTIYFISVQFNFNGCAGLGDCSITPAVKIGAHAIAAGTKEVVATRTVLSTEELGATKIVALIV